MPFASILFTLLRTGSIKALLGEIAGQGAEGKAFASILKPFADKAAQLNHIVNSIGFEKQFHATINNFVKQLNPQAILKIQKQMSIALKGDVKALEAILKKAGANKLEAQELPNVDIIINLNSKSSWISFGIFVPNNKMARNENPTGELTIWTKQGGGGYTYPSVPYDTWNQMVSSFNVPYNGAGSRFWELYLHKYHRSSALKYHKPLKELKTRRKATISYNNYVKAQHAKRGK